MNAALFLAAAGLLQAQKVPGAPDWRHIGNSAIELSLASPASGPVSRVWYSVDGSRLYAQTADARVFETGDFEVWRPATAAVTAQDAPRVIASVTDPLRLYAWGGQVLRSDDGGSSWLDVTGFDRRSILGGEIADLAVSPRNPDEVVAANQNGVWRSLDGGLSWVGLNASLPNLPAVRITSLPQGAVGVRLATGTSTLEWPAGEKSAWRMVPDRAATDEAAVHSQVSAIVGAEVTAMSAAGDLQYAGSADGRLWVSGDRGRTWNVSPGGERGRVEAIWADPRDPRVALAALTRSPRGGTARVLRTVNAGQFWDDLSADLPDADAHGVAADRATGTIYAATDRGVYYSRADLNAAAPAGSWTQLPGLPDGRALDVRLDAAGNQLFVLINGYGVYATLAPHRASRIRLVNAADFSERPAAPGSLLSVLGGRVVGAQAGDLKFPVLAASDTETQIQVPFAARGPSLALALDTGSGSQRLAVSVESVSPAIFVDRDGTPLLLDADTGVLLDAMNTAHSNSRVQILATGLGQVKPDWPAGVAGPAENPPQVITPVRAYLDRAPVEVTRAVLAPGYVGLYLVELQLPPLVNAGPAELYVEQENQQSNRVRLWIQP